jgi:hypothetical protein
MAGKGKQESEHNVTFVKGGNDPMFGQQAAEPQTPGHTEQEDKTGPGAKFAKGGSGKMHSYTPSAEAKAGQTSP